jgi:hypothetical protein
MDDGLPHQHFFVVIGRVDEGLEQVNRADANDGGRKLYFEHGRIHMVQPFGLVRDGLPGSCG